MSIRYRVLPYRQGSRSAKALATALGGKVLKLEGSTFKPKADDVIINWGNTQPTSQVNPNLLVYGAGLPWENYYNAPMAIRMVSNKLNFFNMMKGENADIIPRFWTNKEDIPDEAFPIVCRTVLAGHSGDGIVIANDASELCDAPLYVEYKKKKDEYRVHVGKGWSEPIHGDWGAEIPEEKIIAVQKKAKRHDATEANWQVRNLAGGFIYKRSGITPPDGVLVAAKRALSASGLDFGAVDIIWNELEGKAYVLEINTAPGLEGQTITDYVNFFKGVS